MLFLRLIHISLIFRKEMLELHYPTLTKTILKCQHPRKPTLKVAFENGNIAIFENSSKLCTSLFVTSRWPRPSRQTYYQVHPPSPPKYLLWKKYCNYPLTTMQGDRLANCENIVSLSQTLSLPAPPLPQKVIAPPPPQKL